MPYLRMLLLLFLHDLDEFGLRKINIRCTLYLVPSSGLYCSNSYEYCAYRYMTHPVWCVWTYELWTYCTSMIHTIHTYIAIHAMMKTCMYSMYNIFYLVLPVQVVLVVVESENYRYAGIYYILYCKPVEHEDRKKAKNQLRCHEPRRHRHCSFPARWTYTSASHKTKKWHCCLHRVAWSNKIA